MNPRGTDLNIPLQTFGTSALGSPLQWYPCREKCRILLLATLHGEEPETTVALSRAYRSLPMEALHPAVGSVLCTNPDGMLRGTRCNARGVDLNRNFPTANWQAESTPCRWFADDRPGEELFILTGERPGSEPETQALISLIQDQEPEIIVALHGPLACVDDPLASPLGKWIAKHTGLPLVPDVGYPTPGSMGNWCAEQGIPIITWEFPNESVENCSRSETPVLIDILQGKCPPFI